MLRCGRAERDRGGVKQLQGVRVLDLSRVIAGPFCTRMLGDLGAEVIKVETPQGEASRRAAPQQAGMSALFAQYNAGKLGICVDLRSERGIELVLLLAGRCDVFVENFRAGLAAQIGLGFEAVRAANPAIVYCSISGFGQRGPDAHRPAYTDIIQALSGHDYAAQTMYDNHSGAPPGYPVAVADTCTALNATIAILAALYRRQASGSGEYIDMAMLDAMVASNDSTLQRYLFSDGELDSPSPIFRAPLELADGFMAASIGLNFASTMRAIGRAELIDDARFATPELQRENMALFVEITRAWAADKTVAEVSALFAAHDIPYGQVASTAAVVANPALADRGMFVDVDVDRPGTGGMRLVNTPFNFASGKSAPSGPPPLPGEHTRRVLGEVLGLSSQECEALAAAGIVKEAHR